MDQRTAEYVHSLLQREREQQQQQLRQVLQGLEQRINHAAGGVRQSQDLTRAVEQRIAQCDQRLANLASVAVAFQEARVAPSAVDRSTLRVEDIPGERVPFTLLMEIPIPANSLDVLEQSVTVSQDGMFVAVRRIAVFLSALTYTVSNQEDGSSTTYPGRSFGRFRPIHSAYDIADSQHNSVASATEWFLDADAAAAAGEPLPGGVLSLPSSASSFRTMEFDGRIEVFHEGSQFPRQNISVPSAFWTTEVNAPFDLGALDVWERGTTITVKATPTHVNNPPAGNVDSEAVFAQAASLSPSLTGWPFVAGQYDTHEGICTPECVTRGASEGDYVPLATDTITRTPDGILIIGWEGYRIKQVTGPIF